MALLTCQFFSEVLGLSTSMQVILPQETRQQIGMEGRAISGKHPVLYLLHGLSDDESIWMRRTSIERYVAPLGIAVVMPNVHRSFYTDMEFGGRYWTFLSEELPQLAQQFFPLSDRREDQFVAGLSMGGYGALKWALRQPERFAAAASLSGVTDIAERARHADVHLESTLKFVYGEREIAGTEEDVLWLLEQAARNQGPKPAIYQCCGTEDFLYEDNRKFAETAASVNYEITTEFGPGDHNWEYWDEQIQKVLEWLPLQTRNS
ncbi:esterase [Paenibacillus sp. CAA11]|uniref:alpha/beta hydrolase n=1 Tax=Paenibacillus sp. CAA11 TaxID=1532905 RepID=UPI000D3CB28A|nr:alpha/beta hydrolase family protein [Paenibacillus sp. CAA11]AWB46269.1 esterase [Paenibacillus sp. CAA11]